MVYHHKRDFLSSSTNTTPVVSNRTISSISRWEITLPGNLSRYKAIFGRVVCYVAPSCWNLILQVVFFKWRPKKIGYPPTITLRVASDNLAVLVFQEVRSNHISVPKSAPDIKFFLFFSSEITTIELFESFWRFECEWKICFEVEKYFFFRKIATDRYLQLLCELHLSYMHVDVNMSKCKIRHNVP